MRKIDCRVCSETLIDCSEFFIKRENVLSIEHNGASLITRDMCWV